MSMRIDVDPGEWLQAMKILNKKLMPEAVAETLNTIAQNVNDGSKKNLESEFIIRNQYTLRSLRVSKSRPKPKINTMYSWAGSISPYLGIQETGGERKPAAGKRLPVPTETSRGGDWKRPILPRLRMARIEGAPGIFETPRGIRQRTKRGLTLLRVLMDSYRLRPRRWHGKAVDKYASPAAVREIAEAEIKKRIGKL
jgi:hypothetical protein